MNLKQLLVCVALLVGIAQVVVAKPKITADEPATQLDGRAEKTAYTDPAKLEENEDYESTQGNGEGADDIPFKTVFASFPVHLKDDYEDELTNQLEGNVEGAEGAAGAEDEDEHDASAEDEHASKIADVDPTDLSENEDDEIAQLVSNVEDSKTVMSDPRGLRRRSNDPRGLRRRSNDPRGLRRRFNDPRGLRRRSNDPRGLRRRSNDPRGLRRRSNDPRGLADLDVKQE